MSIRLPVLLWVAGSIGYLLVPSRLRADTVTFTDFHLLTPPVGASISGMNDNGDLAGSFRSGSGYLLLANTTTPISIDYPGAISTSVNGLNNADKLVGAYANQNDSQGFIFLQGFTYLNGNFSPFTVGLLDTNPAAINNKGDITGTYRDAVTSRDTGFLLTGGSVFKFSVPGAEFTSPTGVNDAGYVVGYYSSATCISFIQSFCGFIRSPDGDIATFRFSDARPNAGPSGINNQGIIIGDYHNLPVDNNSHGFVRVGQTSYPLDVPGARNTYLQSINNLNQVMGSNDTAWFSVTVEVSAIPEPSSAITVILGLASLVVLSRLAVLRRSAKEGLRGGNQL